MEEIHPSYHKRLHAWRGPEWFWNALEDARLFWHMKGRNAYIVQAVVEKMRRDRIFQPYEKFLEKSKMLKTPKQRR